MSGDKGILFVEHSKFSFASYTLANRNFLMIVCDRNIWAYSFCSNEILGILFKEMPSFKQVMNVCCILDIAFYIYNLIYVPHEIHCKISCSIRWTYYIW